MDREAVKAHLDGVYDELRSHMDMSDAMDKAFLDKSYIAGGAIVSLVLDEEPKDYDFWFTDYSAFLDSILAMKLEPTRRSKYSTSYVLPSGKEIQLVKSRIGQPADVAGSFDFKHTHCYYMPSRNELVYDEEFIKKKQLVFVPGNLCHPVNTFQRALKFVRRGYTMPNQSIADLMNASGEEYQKRAATKSFATERVGPVYTGDWGGSGDEGSR